MNKPIQEVSEFRDLAQLQDSINRALSAGLDLLDQTVKKIMGTT